MVSSTSPDFFSTTRGDEYDLCASCSVCASHGTACVLHRVLPFSCSTFVSWAHSHSLLFLLLLLTQLLLLLRLSSQPYLLPNRSTSHPLLHFVPGLTSLFCDTRATDCPCQLKNWTSLTKTHPHVHGVHPAVDIQLDDCAVSIVSRFLLIQHHDIASLHDLSH